MTVSRKVIPLPFPSNETYQNRDFSMQPTRVSRKLSHASARNVSGEQKTEILAPICASPVTPPSVWKRITKVVEFYSWMKRYFLTV